MLIFVKPFSLLVFSVKVSRFIQKLHWGLKKRDRFSHIDWSKIFTSNPIMALKAFHALCIINIRIYSKRCSCSRFYNLFCKMYMLCNLHFNLVTIWFVNFVIFRVHIFVQNLSVLPSIRQIIRIYITITIDFVMNSALLGKAFYLPWQFAS